MCDISYSYSTDPITILFLQSISGDSYRVEKSGDETSGFVTKVVMADSSDDQHQKCHKDNKSGPSKEGEAKPKSTQESSSIIADQKSCSATASGVVSVSSEKPLNKRQRQQLKRRARLEAEAAGKQSKKQKVNVKNHPELTSKANEAHHKSQSQHGPTPAQSDELLALQTTWATPLHSTLLSSLHALNYTYPTPIQSATLSAAILGRRDIVGAAPTGSGKTLSYGLPILQWLLENGDEANQGDCKKEEGKEKLPLQALILVPTREVCIFVSI